MHSFPQKWPKDDLSFIPFFNQKILVGGPRGTEGMPKYSIAGPGTTPLRSQNHEIAQWRCARGGGTGRVIVHREQLCHTHGCGPHRALWGHTRWLVALSSHCTTSLGTGSGHGNGICGSIVGPWSGVRTAQMASAVLQTTPGLKGKIQPPRLSRNKSYSIAVDRRQLVGNLQQLKKIWFLQVRPAQQQMAPLNHTSGVKKNVRGKVRFSKIYRYLMCPNP